MACAQIQASSEDGGVLGQTPTLSTIPVASQAVRVALEREFPSARPTIADPSGSDSDAPLVSRGRFAALSDDMTVLVERCPGRVDNCSRVAIPIGEENHTRRLRMSQATTVAVPPETLDVAVQSDRGRRLILVGANRDHRSPVERACSKSDTDSVMWSGDEDCGGSLVSGEEEPGELLCHCRSAPGVPFSSASEERVCPVG